MKKLNYVQIDSIYDALVFAQLKENGICTRIRNPPVLVTDPLQRCSLFSVPIQEANTFCKHQFPLSFSRSSPLPDILFFAELLLRTDSKILTTVSYAFSVVVNLLYYACRNCFLIIND